MRNPADFGGSRAATPIDDDFASGSVRLQQLSAAVVASPSWPLRSSTGSPSSPSTLPPLRYMLASRGAAASVVAGRALPHEWLRARGSTAGSPSLKRGYLLVAIPPCVLVDLDPWRANSPGDVDRGPWLGRNASRDDPYLKTVNCLVAVTSGFTGLRGMMTWA